MSEKTFEVKNDKITITLEVTPKGIKTFTLYLDDFELVETGSKIKDGKENKPVLYHKYRVAK